MMKLKEIKKAYQEEIKKREKYNKAIMEFFKFFKKGFEKYKNLGNIKKFLVKETKNEKIYFSKDYDKKINKLMFWNENDWITIYKCNSYYEETLTEFEKWEKSFLILKENGEKNLLKLKTELKNIEYIYNEYNKALKILKNIKSAQIKEYSYFLEKFFPLLKQAKQ